MPKVRSKSPNSSFLTKFTDYFDIDLNRKGSKGSYILSIFVLLFITGGIATLIFLLINNTNNNDNDNDNDNDKDDI